MAACEIVAHAGVAVDAAVQTNDAAVDGAVAAVVVDGDADDAGDAVAATNDENVLLVAGDV